MEDVGVIKANCEEYAGDSKAIDVLRNANGKRDYKEIASIVDVHPTRASGLLSKASKLGLAEKLRNGNYKKTPGVLEYMPKKTSTNKKHDGSIEKIISKKPKVGGIKSVVSPTVNISKRILTPANKMGEAYLKLYYTENALRELIRIVFFGEKKWWDNRVPSDVKSNVSSYIKNEKYHAVNRLDGLEYTHLGDLKKIIVKNNNWPFFKSYLNEKDRDSFAATVDKAIPSRNAIGHCIPLAPKDLKYVEMRFEDILKMVK